ncbi:hypothetical protein FISHEDRAFT_29202, partial [Fistulina hepatica ATCC 64428]
SVASDDPTRKYCLGKFVEIFSDVFARYACEADESRVPSDEENGQAEKRARHFATELEQAVYDIYSEPDKSGQFHAGAKYKDRFRMLQFNLSKKDRVQLHKRIVSGQISPKEISLMSSTDLADEGTKQSIKMAEKEALEHSILQKTTAPHAKIT